MKLFGVLIIGLLLTGCSTGQNLYNFCGPGYTDYDVVIVERYKNNSMNDLKHYTICRKDGKSKIVTAEDYDKKMRVKE